MKALVIGGTGPTGPYIVQGLVAQGYEPVILHRGTHETDLGVDVEHIHADPHFAETLTAALGDRTFDLVVATYGRLRLFVDVLKGKTFHMVTIGGTGYDYPNSAAATESSPRRTENKIIRKIVETEEVIRAAHDRGDFSITHFRYPNLYGPRQLAPREWSIIRRIRDGRPFVPVLDGGLTLEGRAYVENAAHAVLLAVSNLDAGAGRQYNVADQYTPTDAERVRVVAECMGADIEVANFPRNAGGPGYWWGAGRDLDFAREGTAPITHHKLLSVESMERDLGYSDKVPFRDAMRRTVEWYLENPLEAGSEEERQIGDPFDYAAEDRFYEELNLFEQRCSVIEFAGSSYDHPYAHPKEPAIAQAPSI